MPLPERMHRTLTDYVAPTTDADVDYYKAQGYFESRDAMLAAATDVSVIVKPAPKVRTRKAE